MSTSPITFCVGSADSLMREYVHDFGLCALDFTFVGDALPHHLATLAMDRAEWQGEGARRGVKRKNLSKVVDPLSELTFGGLVSRYCDDGGKPHVVALLEPIVETRNRLLHNRLPLSDNRTIAPARLNRVRADLHRFPTLNFAVRRLC